MEKILALPVNSPVHASPIFTYLGASDPPSLSHNSLAEILSPKVNPKPRNNPPNTVLYVPSDLDSNPGLSDYSSSESSDLSDGEYFKQIQCVKKNKK